MGDVFNASKNAAVAGVETVSSHVFFKCPDKSIIFFSQGIQSLRFRINSKKITVSLSFSKQNDIKVPLEVEVKTIKRLTIREFAKSVGKSEIFLPRIQDSRLYILYLHHSKTHSFGENQREL